MQKRIKRKRRKKYEKEISKGYFPHMCSIPDVRFDCMQFILTGTAGSTPGTGNPLNRGPRLHQQTPASRKTR